MSWLCSNCRSEVDDEIDLCWQCGTGIKGEPPPIGWRLEQAPLPDGSERELLCLRCSSPMSHLGHKQLHEGSYLKELFLGDFFVNRETFDIYGCGNCGKVEFYVSSPAA